jgi:hypothetical protein
MSKLFCAAALFVCAVAFMFAETLPGAETSTGTEAPAGTPSDSSQSVERRMLPFSVNAGLEVNNNHSNGAAAGVSVMVDWRIMPFLSAGLRTGFSSNFGYSNTAEAEGFVRFVLPLGGIELFAQGGAGVSWIFIYEGNTAVPLFGGAFGARIPLGGFYLEPAARFGSPFLWGAGVSAGKVFFGKK